jgi:hypothetical protein
MATPDLSDYVDFTVYDLQPQEIYDAAVQYATTALPEWTPIPGSVEDALLQASASMTGQLLGAINRMPSGVVEALLKLYGVERIVGAAASATAEVTFIDTNGHSIPKGARVGYSETVNGETSLYLFETTETLNVGVGASTGFVGITAITNQRYPSLTAGEPLQMLSAVSSVDAIELAVDLNPGADPETDAEFIARSRAAFGQLSEALTLPAQMDRYALTNYANVYRAKTYSRVKAFRPLVSLTRSGGSVTAVLDTNPTSGSASSTVEADDVVRIVSADEAFNGTFTVVDVNGDASEIYWLQSGDSASASSAGAALSFRFQDDDYDVGEGAYQWQNGYVTTYASAIGGASLSVNVLDSLQTDLTDRAVAGLIIGTDHAHVVDVGIDVEVTKQPAVPQSEVQDGITAALEGYVDPDFWPWDGAIYRNEIIALLDRVPGVVRVVDVTLTDLTGGSITEVTGGGSALEFKYFGILPAAVVNITVVP